MVPGMAPGTVPGMVPGVPGMVPGEVPGTVPGTVPGEVPGEVPGAAPGAIAWHHMHSQAMARASLRRFAAGGYGGCVRADPGPATLRAEPRGGGAG